MSAIKAETFVVIATASNCWGKGRNLAEAMKNCRSAGARRGEAAIAMAIAAPYGEVEIYSGIELCVQWPQEKVAVKFDAKL